MQAKLTVNGLNLFLTRIFDEDIRLSIVLSDLEFNPHQVEELRRHYLDHIVIFCIELIDERLLSDRNGERPPQSGTLWLSEKIGVLDG